MKLFSASFQCASTVTVPRSSSRHALIVWGTRVFNGYSVVWWSSSQSRYPVFTCLHDATRESCETRTFLHAVTSHFSLFLLCNVQFVSLYRWLFVIFFDSILDFVSFCINFCFAFYRDEMCERNGALCLCERKSANAFMDPHLLDVLIGTAVQAANQLLSVLPQLICMTNPPLSNMWSKVLYNCCVILIHPIENIKKLRLCKYRDSLWSPTIDVHFPFKGFHVVLK